MSSDRQTIRKEWDFMTFGDVFIDLVMSGFGRWPAPGEEVDAASMTREVGGGAAITACGLARLGRRVALLAAIGADGSWFRERVGGTGVATDLLRTAADESTAITVAISTTEDRSFFTYRGANQLLAELIGDPATVTLMTRASHLHLASAIAPDALIQLARQIRPTGTTISIDVGWVEPWLADPESLVALREVDLFMPNEREGAAMTGGNDPQGMLRAFAAAGLTGVVLKLGASGSMMLDAGRIEKCPGVPVTPVDTTGAGDCFDAGFLAAWKSGLSVRDCLEIGNFCGARSTTAAGGLNGFPERGELGGRLDRPDLTVRFSLR